MGIGDFNLDLSENTELVLLVSQDLVERAAATALLGKRGYRVVACDSSVEASEFARGNLVGLMVYQTSEKLPPRELIDKLRRDAQLRRVPLLFIQPGAVREKLFIETEFGRAVQLLDAPIDPAEFLTKVATQLRLRKLAFDQADSQSRLAAQNAQLRDLNNRFKRELVEAKTIQENLLPKSLPVSKLITFAGVYLPLEAVGGDVYDVWTISENRFGIFIGDVTGHGLPAAFIGAMTKMALHYSSNDSTEKLLSEMNKGIMSSLPDERFITVAAAIYQADTRELLVSRGGHPPAYLFEKASGEVTPISPRGFPLGVTDDARYELFRKTLSPGDKFMLVTDGLTESSDMDSRMLGIDGVGRIFQAAAPGRDINACLDEVLQQERNFRGERIAKDDITVVGFEVLG